MNHRLVQNKKQYDGPGMYIGRPSELGNPFTIGEDGTRDEVIDKYIIWFEAHPEEWKARIRRKYRGKVLICWCRPFRCHGDYIAQYVNEEETK